MPSVFCGWRLIALPGRVWRAYRPKDRNGNPAKGGLVRWGGVAVDSLAREAGACVRGRVAPNKHLEFNTDIFGFGEKP